MPDAFSPDLRRFIDGNIESLAQLETLLLLRQDAARQWNADQIAASLYIPRDMAASLLEDLSRRNFLKRMAAAETSYSYEPADPEAARVIEELAGVYRERRVAVISAIYSKPLNKVQTFADAFRLRKET